MPGFVDQYSITTIGILASLAAGSATGLGALLIFFLPTISRKLEDAMLGFAAGVMLAATAFSLILPAVEFGGGGVSGVTIAAFGILVGAVFLDFVDRYSPHRHFFVGLEGKAAPRLAQIWLFVIAIAIHNFPEGLAVGVSFGGGDVANGLTVATAIGLQNMPEGLAVAAALRRERYSSQRAFAVALFTGLVEPVGGVLGLLVVEAVAPLLPYALAFAAGAMLFVISDEIIPETHRRGHERVATYAVIVGFVLMMFLDTVFA